MKKSTATASHPIAFRCPPDVLESVKKKAKEEDRTISNLIVHLLRQHAA